MTANYYQVALDSEDYDFVELFPEDINAPFFFRLGVNLAGHYFYGSVTKAAKSQDYCNYCKSLAAERDSDKSTFDAGSDFFLVPKYDWETIIALVTSFFEQVRVGDNLHELLLKSFSMFANEAFWEDYPPRIDMEAPPFPYQFKVRGLVDEAGKLIDWEDVHEGYEIQQRMDLQIELIFESDIRVVSLRLHPIEDFYDWILAQEAPKLMFAGNYGLRTIKKQKTNALIQDFFDHMEGSSIEEILLRWAVVVHVPDLPTLLQTPLSPGGSFTLDPIGIQIGRAKIRNLNVR
jgi:hypothetical protein